MLLLFLEAQRIATLPGVLEAQKLASLPGILAAQDAAITASEELNITQLNSVLSQFNQIPNENFQAIKQVVAQNQSRLRNVAKANYETSSNIVKQAFENDTDDTLILPICIAELIADIDDSAELPKSDSKQMIHINKSNINTYMTAISLLISILSFAGFIYQSQASTVQSKQQHAELMQEEHKQTRLMEREVELKEEQIQLEKQRIKIEERELEHLEQIAENTTPNNNTD